MTEDEALAFLTKSIEPIAEPLTLETLYAAIEKLRLRRTIVCHADNDLAVRRAVKELEAEGIRADVVVSQFVRPGQVFVIDPEAWDRHRCAF